MSTDVEINDLIAKIVLASPMGRQWLEHARERIEVEGLIEDLLGRGARMPLVRQLWFTGNIEQARAVASLPDDQLAQLSDLYANLMTPHHQP